MSSLQTFDLRRNSHYNVQLGGTKEALPSFLHPKEDISKPHFICTILYVKNKTVSQIKGFVVIVFVYFCIVS